MTETIYVVDDDAINLKIISAALKSAGYQVVTAENAAQTLENIGKAHADLAILDVMMPDMDGYELCRHLRSRPDTSKIPIIMLTALTGLDERLKGFEAGADDFVSKPFHPQELDARVKVLLRRLKRQNTAVTNRQSETTAIFSLRGGVGVSTFAANLAVGFAQIWSWPAALIDLCMLNGQSALMLNAPVRNSWSDIAAIPANEIDADILQQILLTHESGLRLIACPSQPEYTESLTVEQVQRTLLLLKQQFDYLVLDLPHDFNPITLTALNGADRIVLVLAPELASIRCAHIALDVFDRLNYPPEKIKLLLNWTFSGKGLARDEIEKAIKRKIDMVFPNTGDLLASAITKGTPPVYHESDGAVGILFEDLAYHWSKDAHRMAPDPATTKDSYNRIQERVRVRQKRT